MYDRERARTRARLQISSLRAEASSASEASGTKMHRHTEDHPTRNEDEYFARESAQLIKEMRSLLDEQRREVDRREHLMKCPKCGGDLKERDFEDVKVDVCPECHGIWLDQGEIGLIRHIHESRGPFSRIMSDILEIFHHPKTGEPSSPTSSSG